MNICLLIFIIKNLLKNCFINLFLNKMFELHDINNKTKEVNTSDDTSANTNISLQNTSLKLNDDSFFLDLESDSHNLNSLTGRKHIHQRRLGNMFAFLYKNGEPLLVIGPHCI
jgi:hypothetical protein